jgi:periplasmic divalent cation tolerance protein
MTEHILVMTNVSDLAAARHLARELVSRRLAACVNCLSAVQSVYWWQGEIEEAAEVSLLIKTTSSRYPELAAAIRQLHAYQLPEIIAIPIVAGLPQYLDWITQETTRDEDA